jgi:hypothetical protein
MGSDPDTNQSERVAAWLSATVAGAAPPWPDGAGDHFGDAVCEAAIEHGVCALLARRHAREGSPAWPTGLRRRLRAHLAAAAAAEVLRRLEVERVVSAFARGGVPSVLLKGTPLAYTHYPQPWLRPRADTDVLIIPERRSASAEAMTQAGYHRGIGFGGELVTHQDEWERVDEQGLRHVFDIHTRIANPHLFARLLEFPELVRRSVPVPALGPGARALGVVDALLLAGIHRAAHHHGANRLIWLYDISLLLGTMNANDLRSVVSLATSKGIRAVTGDAITEACVRFSVPVPSELTALEVLPPGRPEATASFLEPGRAKVDILLADLRALPGWGQRARLVVEHLFPPADFMRKAYPRLHPVILPLAYTHRILTGVAKWFRSTT